MASISAIWHQWRNGVMAWRNSISWKQQAKINARNINNNNENGVMAAKRNVSNKE
jgi:hypothetical protein